MCDRQRPAAWATSMHHSRSVQTCLTDVQSPQVFAYALTLHVVHAGTSIGSEITVYIAVPPSTRIHTLSITNCLGAAMPLLAAVTTHTHCESYTAVKFLTTALM